MTKRRRFTSAFKKKVVPAVLRDAGIKISMDGRGRYLDNIFIERLWSSLKYECAYLKDMVDGFVAQKEIGDWINFYNRIRPHSSLDGQTPHEVYSNSQGMGNPMPCETETGRINDNRIHLNFAAKLCRQAGLLQFNDSLACTWASHFQGTHLVSSPVQ